MTADSDWKTRNLAAIKARLKFLADLPDGAIHKRVDSMHRLVVHKVGSRLELQFFPEVGQEIISDLVFTDPLFLWAGHTQAMMLGLLWKPEPKRVYVVGFGAGRIPMVLHHFYPNVVVECSEIDRDVFDVAKNYFGVQSDSRLLVAIQDGRAYLNNQKSEVCYDIIVVDAFRGMGFSPVTLGTLEFYQLCKQHLTTDGVVVCNLLAGDPQFVPKLKTMLEAFGNVQCVSVGTDGTFACFGWDGPNLGGDELLRRATEIQEVREFSFPFVDHARELRRISDFEEIALSLPAAQVLTDETPPLPRDRVTEKVGRNEPCPCGSRKKYKKCHGQSS